MLGPLLQGSDCARLLGVCLCKGRDMCSWLALLGQETMLVVASKRVWCRNMWHKRMFSVLHAGGVVGGWLGGWVQGGGNPRGQVICRCFLPKSLAWVYIFVDIL